MNVSSSWSLPGGDVLADIASVRRRGPLTQCMTNIVAANVTANALLAVGASPAMVEHAEEAGEFAGIADALLVNVGTLSQERAGEAMLAAAASANEIGTPWVLDPVAVGALRFRTKLATALVEHHPRVVRGNASEILSLAGADGAVGKGVESLAESAEALDAARSLATAHGTVVAVSGEVDYITDGRITRQVPGGHRNLTRVTGVGCALGALMAAFLAVQGNPLRAVVSASTLLAAAGERAAGEAAGIGSFATALLDSLDHIAETAAARDRA